MICMGMAPIESKVEQLELWIRMKQNNLKRSQALLEGKRRNMQIPDEMLNELTHDQASGSNRESVQGIKGNNWELMKWEDEGGYFNDA